MDELTDLERDVLQMILSGEHLVLESLRRQLDECRVVDREITGGGFFTHFNVSDHHVAPTQKLRFGDVVAEIGGLEHGAGFVLFVDNGKLSMLEGYSYDEPWPESTANYELKYTLGEERDWEALQASLSEFS